jgi:hypothetical protein
MTQQTKAAPEKTVAPIPPAILEGIIAGHIAHDIESVTIRAASSPTKKDEVRPFDAFYALDLDGIVILSGGKLEAQTPTPEGKDERTEEQKRLGAADNFYYGRLLSVRQQERAKLEASIEGPEKAIDKTVKALMTGGMFGTEQEAREFVIAKLKANGSLAADYSYPGSAE